MDTRADSIQIYRVTEQMTAETEKALIAEYKRALTDMKKELATMYEKYSKDGSLTFAEMAKYHRLEGMISEVNSQMNATYTANRAATNQLAKNCYEESYYRTGYSIEQAAQAKLSYTMLNPKTIQASIENPIAGLKLSETLSQNRAQVITKLKSNITQGLIKGESYAKMAKRMNEVLGGDAVKAMRVARTEAARNYSQGSLAAMEHAISKGVSIRKEWIATLDERTRDTHAAMDGVIVDADKNFRLPSGAQGPAPRMTGVAAEDINCRCALGKVVAGAGDTVARQTYMDWAKEHGIPKSKYDRINELQQIEPRARLRENIAKTRTDLSEAAKDNSLGKYMDADGNLTPEREELHQQILADLFKDATPVTDGKPTFYMMGGGPASGKSSVIKAGNVTLPKNMVSVDSDAIKAKLPDYQDMIKANNPRAAAFVHEESSALAKRAMQIAQSNGYNSMLDGTGDGSVGSLMKKISQARTGGSQVVGYYVTCPTEEALKRATARAAKTGRVVMDDVIIGTHRKVSQILPECAQYFDRVELYDTTTGVKLIATGGQGKGLIAEKGMSGLLDDFLKKGG